MGTLAPNDAMAAGPVAPGFFQVWVPAASLVPTAEVGVRCRLEFSGRAVVPTLGVSMCVPYPSQGQAWVCAPEY